MNLGRNDQCPCLSGKKYKLCCMGSVDWPHLMGKPLGEVAHHFTLRGRNLTFIRLMFEALGIDPEDTNGSSVKFKRAFTSEAVRKIYECVDLMWPGLDDYEHCLKNESQGTSALYTGSYEPEHVAKAVIRHSLYADKILLTDPFLSPRIVRDQFNPLLHPEEFRTTCLINATLWLHMLPWIAAGVVGIVRPIRDFEKGLWHKILEAQKARFSKHPELEDMSERMAKEQLKSLSPTDGGLQEYFMLSHSDKFYIDELRKDRAANPAESHPSDEDMLSHLRRRREMHPYYLPDADLTKSAQYLFQSTGSCYEEVKLMSQIGDLHMITDLPSRWLELQIDRAGVDSKSSDLGWSPFAKALQKCDLKILNDVTPKAAIALREEGRLENMRHFFRRVWQSSKSGEELDEGNAANLAAELEHQIAEANTEWGKIDQSLLKWLGVQGSAVAAAAAQFQILPALSAAAITGTVGMIDARMRRKAFARRYPAGFFLRLKHQ